MGVAKHHGVAGERGTVREYDAVLGEVRDLAVYPDAPRADVGHRPDVEQRDLPVPGNLAVRPIRELLQAGAADIARREPDKRPRQRIGHCRRDVPHRDTELQDGDHTEDVPGHDVDRRTHRQVGPGPPLEQVDRLLASGVAEAHDKHRATDPRIAIPVVARVQHLTAV
jgi:hypothetical protein